MDAQLAEFHVRQGDQNSLFRDRVELTVVALRNASVNLKILIEKSDEQLARLLKGIVELFASCWSLLHPKLAAEKQRSLAKLIADFQRSDFGFVQSAKPAQDNFLRDFCRRRTGRTDSGLDASDQSQGVASPTHAPKPKQADLKKRLAGDNGFENSFGGDHLEVEVDREDYFKKQYTMKNQVSGYFSSMVESPELKRTQAFEYHDFNFETVLKSTRKVDAQVQTDRNPTPAVGQSPPKKSRPAIPNPSKLSSSSISQQFSAIKSKALINKSSTQDRSSLLKSSFFLNDMRVVAKQPETNLYVVPRPRVKTSTSKLNVSSLLAKGKAFSSLENSSPVSSSQIVPGTDSSELHKHTTSLSNLIALRYDPESEHNPSMFKNLYTFN